MFKFKVDALHLNCSNKEHNDECNATLRRRAGATKYHHCGAAGNLNNLATINNTADQHLISGTGMVPVTSKAIKMGKVRERMVQACSHQVAEAAVQLISLFVSTPAVCASVK